MMNQNQVNMRHNAKNVTDAKHRIAKIIRDQHGAPTNPPLTEQRTQKSRNAAIP